MSHLLAISVGPVQEFIAAARRTRDLWFGSYLLSEVSKVVAKSVQDHHGELIFPHPNAKLEPDPNVNVANVILAELGAGDPREVAAQAKEAAQKQWLEFAADAWNEASGVARTDIWNDQVQDVIEFFAAWVRHTDPKNYQEDRARVMRLMAGRKNCRDFLPAKGRAGVPKSSLDGQRESVLKRPSEWPARFRARLRVREGEQLDVVGVVKRVAGGPQRYPSVARVAVDPWVRGNHSRLADVISACRELGDKIIRPLNTTTHPQFAAFPFEGTAVFMSRHYELQKETEVQTDRLRQLRDALARFLAQLEPYLAVLIADGDKMGEAISRLDTPTKHRAFSQALAGFADEARRITNAHNGILVYAGGDDVLAFVPVDRCLDCARKLHDRFIELLKDYKNEEGQPPTLSIGLAIGHFMENLEDLLEYAHAAEKHAKYPRAEDHGQEPRDGLAVHLHKRGGAPIELRWNWSENPDARIKGYAVSLNRDDLPGKLAYELRTLADLYKGWRQESAADKKTMASAISQDIKRLLAKKQPGSGKAMTLDLSHVKDSPSLNAFAEELLVARLIATALKQSGEGAS